METLAQKIPFLTVLIGDFIAISKKWCSQDSTNLKGIIIEKLTCQFDPQVPADLVTFTEEILNGKLPFCEQRSPHGDILNDQTRMHCLIRN